jgi:PAS domain S-box-containing protein
MDARSTARTQRRRGGHGSPLQPQKLPELPPPSQPQPGSLQAQLAALAERERSWHVLFENSPDAILRTSPDGTVHAANAAACALIGRDEAEIRRLGRTGIIDCSEPGWCSLVTERQRHGHAICEGTLIRSDGTRLPVEISAVLYRDARGEVRSDMFVRDISRRHRMLAALRESEARYRHLVEDANDMIYVCDPHGYWLHVNSNAVLRILGYAEDDLVGHHFLEIIPPDWHERAARFYREQFERRLATTYFECPVRVADSTGRCNTLIAA